MQACHRIAGIDSDCCPRCSYSYTPFLSGPDLIHLCENIITLLCFFKTVHFRIEIKNEGVIKETHIKEFMKNLNGFRNSEMFCDFTLIVKDEVRIPVHRVVMMACSEYIRTLLTYETSDDNVTTTTTCRNDAAAKTSKTISSYISSSPVYANATTACTPVLVRSGKRAPSTLPSHVP